MNIRSRLTLQFVASVAALILILLTSIYIFSAQYRQWEIYDRLRAKAITTTYRFVGVQGMDSTLLRVIDESKKDVLPNENITLYNDKDQVLYANNDSIHFHMSGVTLDEIRQHREMKFTQGDYEIIGLSYTVSGKGGVVVTAGAIDYFGLKKLEDLRRILIVGFVIGLVIVAGVGWLYAGRALQPINRIVGDMNQISASNLDARLDEGNGADEIAQLAQTFNMMLVRLEGAFNLQKSFVANVSHELKNPLTKITAQLEVVLLRQRESGEYRKTIESVLEDIKSLNQVSVSLLDLARISGDELGLKFTPIRLDEILWNCRERLTFIQPNYHVQIDFALPDDENGLIVAGNDYLLTAAFLNLMDNGCKFSPDHSVKVSMLLDAQGIVVMIQDQGIGMDQEDQAQMFNPFFRGKNSTAINGHGIGLSLVKRIFELHRVQITLNSEVGKGTTFTLRFPAAPFRDSSDGNVVLTA